jgi:hypothetical protein
VCPAVRGMHRLTATFVAALFVVAFAAAPARAGLCDLLGTCGPAIGPPAPALDPDGALHVDTPMQPLPAPAAGQPLFDRVGGHLQLGLTERAYDGSPSGFGQAATADQEVAFVRGIGGTLLRVPVSWAQAEPDPPVAGAHDYSWPRDDLYRSLVSQGVRPILTLLAAPRWALTSSVGCTQVCNQPPGAAHAADFAAFAGAVARRYPLAAAIEIWNEPNNHHGSVQGPRPDEYAALLAQAHDAIKAQRPAMRVLGGSLGAYGASPLQLTTATDMRLGDYLQAMLAGGAAAHMDGLSFHPYPHSVEPNPDNTFYDVFSVVHDVLAANGDGAERLVPSEFGMSTTEASQTERSAVLRARWHDLNDPSPDAAHPVPGAGRVDAAVFHTDVIAINYDHYGWLSVVSNRSSFHPYPVWCDFARMLAGRQSCPATIQPPR